MRALLLAAGLGTRLRPITNRIPKCLIPINGTSLLDIWFSLILKHDIDRVLVNTHYLADVVRKHILGSRWKHRVDLVHEVSLMGTGGTILANRDYFQNKPFLVAHADNLTSFDVAAFVARHKSRPLKAQITMMTFRTDTPQSCGIVELDEEGNVVGFHEKVTIPPGDLANGAVYIFEPTIIEFMADLKKTIVDLSAEVLPNFLGRIATYENSVYHRDIGTPESLNKAMDDYPRALRALLVRL